MKKALIIFAAVLATYAGAAQYYYFGVDENGESQGKISLRDYDVPAETAAGMRYIVQVSETEYFTVPGFSALPPARKAQLADILREYLQTRKTVPLKKAENAMMRMLWNFNFIPAGQSNSTATVQADVEAALVQIADSAATNTTMVARLARFNMVRSIIKDNGSSIADTAYHPEVP